MSSAETAWKNADKRYHQGYEAFERARKKFRASKGTKADYAAFGKAQKTFDRIKDAMQRAENRYVADMRRPKVTKTMKRDQPRFI